MPTASDLVTDLPADFEVFGQAVDTSLADLKGGTTGQVLSKTSGTDMDFTWVTTDDANAIQNSIVDAKGDLVAASANDTPARLAVGANGETLVADSSTSTGLRYQGSTAAGRNFAINGGFDIWQRGTTFSTNGSYTADRWYFTYGGTVTAAQETTVVQDGSTNSIKLTTGAATSFGELYNALEAAEVNFLAGKTITISGSVRVSSAVAYTGGAVIAIQTNTTANTQTGGTWTEASNTSQAPSTSAWTRFSLTYTVPSGTKGLRVRLGNTATQASGTIIYWSNIQIEVGSVATGFSRAGGTIQGELAACQRYYQKSYAQSVSVPTNVSTAGTVYAVSGNVSASGVVGRVGLPVVMRTSPTVVIYSNTTSQVSRVSDAGGTDLAANSGVALAAGDSGFSVQNTSGGTITAAYNGFIFHYAASAEL